MRNVFVALLFLLLLVFPSEVSANGSFEVSSQVTYEVKVSGLTTVTHDISLQNLESEVYTPDFRLLLDNIEPLQVYASEDNEQLETLVNPRANGNEVVVTFPNALVGEGKTRRFTITYEDASIAKRSGEVWEVSVPRLRNTDSFDSYLAKLIVPKSLGDEAYISPEPQYQYDTETVYAYEYNREQLISSGITAGFGGVQVFSFSLSYHLENPLNKAALTSIAVPPDTSTQRVYYSDISPEPDKISLDEDGNWIAEYSLEPRERLDVTAKGTIEIFSVPKSLISTSADVLAHNLSATQYWQSDDPVIREIAATMTTPRDVYDYVINTLSYDYNRVRPNIERVGALGALDNPNNAICMEFTDLFIAIARAAGIPAREINGYAYTENPEIEPLSLVADVLHAWPEYWDDERNVWVPVDPTWGKTTNGVDYFDKLDLRHVAFVIHGKSDTYPFPAGSYKLGANPQKDVYISFGQAPAKKKNDIKINASMSRLLPFTHRSVDVLVTNYGPRAEYNFPVVVAGGSSSFDTEYIEVLPPFGTYRFTSSLPHTVWGNSLPETISIESKDTKFDVKTHSTMQLLINLTVVLVVLIVLLLVVLFKIGKIRNPFSR